MKQRGSIRISRRGLTVSCVAALGIALVASAGRVAHGATSSSPSTTQTIQVRSLEDGHAISGSKAKLQRKSDRLKLRVETAQLDPGETLDVFWAVFNNPSACINGNPITGVPCGPAVIVAGTGAFEGLRGSGEMEVVNDPDDDSLAHVTFTGPVTR